MKIHIIVRLLWAFCLIAAPQCGAQMLDPETFVGRTYWFEPAHEKYAPTNFYRSPAIDAATLRITRRDRLRVMDAKKGWLAIGIASLPGAPPQAYLPIRIFRSRLYQRAGVWDTYDTFARASIFEDDPDVLKRKFESRDPRSASAASGKLPPWQKYKENWGGVKLAPAKKSRLPWDDSKQPAADATQ